jgi:hypothetical protein
MQSVWSDASTGPVVALPGMDCAHIFRAAVIPNASDDEAPEADVFPGRRFFRGPEAAQIGRRWLASVLWLWQMVEFGSVRTE